MSATYTITGLAWRVTLRGVDGDPSTHWYLATKLDALQQAAAIIAEKLPELAAWWEEVPQTVVAGLLTRILDLLLQDTACDQMQAVALWNEYQGTGYGWGETVHLERIATLTPPDAVDLESLRALRAAMTAGKEPDAD